MISPITLTGELIQRKIISPVNQDEEENVCKAGWDDPLPTVFKNEWEAWKQSLVALSKLKIPRSFVEEKPVSHQEVHIFSDASDMAIGHVAYLKTVYNDLSASVAFILGNSKLAPRKATSTPRLELCAALEASRAARLVIIPTQETCY